MLTAAAGEEIFAVGESVDSNGNLIVLSK